MLAHAEAGARLRGGWRLGGKLRRGKAFEDRELLAEAFRPRELHQALGEAPLEHDRRIARGIGAERNAAVDLTGGDLGAKAERALQARAAGLHHGDAGRGWAERAADHRFARKVPVLGVGDHGAADDLIDMRAMQREPVDQSAERSGQHVEIGQFGVGRMRAAKGDSHPAKHRDTPHLLFLHDGLKFPSPLTPLARWRRPLGCGGNASARRGRAQSRCRRSRRHRRDRRWQRSRRQARARIRRASA